MENNILANLSKEERKYLSVQSFNKNQIIFHEGDLCDCVSIVTSGTVQITSYSFSGKEVVFNTLSKNQIFGNNLIFSSEPFYKGSVVSTTKSTIVFVKKDDLLNLLATNPSFLKEYLRVQSDFGKHLNATIKLFSIDSAKERFEYYLFINKGEIDFKTISSLASELNLKRETLSRLTSKLEKENVIKRSLHHISKIN